VKIDITDDGFVIKLAPTRNGRSKLMIDFPLSGDHPERIRRAMADLIQPPEDQREPTVSKEAKP